MLLLSLMLLLGFAAAVWGFLMCFAPARWTRLTEFADSSNSTQAAGQHPTVRNVIRVGNCVAGLAIFAVGCWFSYVAASEIYLVFTGKTTLHPYAPRDLHRQGSTPPQLVFLSVFVALVGAAMAVSPIHVLRVLDYIRFSGHSMERSVTPIVRICLRIFGIALIVLATMSLMQ